MQDDTKPAFEVTGYDPETNTIEAEGDLPPVGEDEVVGERRTGRMTLQGFYADIGDRMLGELTREEAVALHDARWWEKAGLSDNEVALLQLQQTRLTMPFDIFHRLVEKLLDRPVWTHEFARPLALLAELQGRKPPPRSPMESLAEVAPGKPFAVLRVPEEEEKQ